MPRYFFHLNFPTKTIADPEGAETDGIDSAKTEARDAIREIAAEYFKAGKPLTLGSISVCDIAGSEIAVIKTVDALD